MRTFHHPWRLWAISIVACLAPVHGLWAGDDAAVTISLFPEASVAAEIILLRDIATLTGGTPRQREQLGLLDIGRMVAGVDSVRLSKSQVDLRLRLAAIETAWLVRGPSETTVRRLNASTLESLVVGAIRSEYAAALPVADEDLHVQLSYPLPATLLQEYPQHVSTLAPELETPPRFGRVSVRLRGMHEGALVRVYQVQVDVRRCQPVAILQVPIRAGQRIEPSQVVWDRQSIARPDDMLRTAAELEDQVATTSLRTGTWLQRRHLRRPTVQPSPDIRARDEVRVVAARGGLTVALSGGVALESGRVGDSIRVRNPHSGQILNVRVVSSTEVRIPF